MHGYRTKMGGGRDVNSNRARVLLNIYIGIELQDSKRGGEGRKIATFHVYRVFNVLLAVTTMVSQKSIWVYKKFKKSTKSPRPPPPSIRLDWFCSGSRYVYMV